LYLRTSTDDQGEEQARLLLHDLANDLAAIQMRADILIATTEASTPPLLQADLVTIRTTAAHAITTTEQFALIITEADRPRINGQED
jgi:hypothetical protein